VIGPLLRISWLALVRDRWALLLSFMVPIAFFSILALVLGGADGRELPPVRVVVLDEDRTEASALVVAALRREPALVVETRTPDRERPARDVAQDLVRRGAVPAVVVVPAGFAERLSRFPAKQLTVELFGDPASDPVAHRLAGGLLQRALVVAAPDRLIGGVTRWIEGEAGELTPPQRELLNEIGKAIGSDAGGEGSPFRVIVHDVQAADGGRGRTVISYYAAGIGVMFLLFTMTAATRGLISEQETGTLERLLATGLPMGRLLFARWLFATALGCVQLSVMFLWGWAVFGVDVFGRGHLPGVLVMTVAAAAAAASFGLVLGTACRTQAQVQGLSTVVILLMSALGGSMVPRFMMPETMQRLGLVTFNAWALVGYERVFWRDAAVVDLWPQLGMLAGMAVVGLTVARQLARRWESV
jgi:ABC-2 type transport system permease protein